MDWEHAATVKQSKISTFIRCLAARGNGYAGLRSRRVPYTDEKSAVSPEIYPAFASLSLQSASPSFVSK
jgi:hypothetical protein